MKNIILVSFLVIPFLINCAGKKVYSSENKVTKDKVISVHANWVKDKGGKYDIELVVESLSDNNLIFTLAEMRCAKGTATGELKHTFFNTGERTIDFTPHEIKKFRMVCKTGVEGPGDYTITIGRVFANPSNDGKTKGKVLASNLVWTGKQEQGK